MSWIIEIAKALVVCAGTIFLLIVSNVIFSLNINNSKATGLALGFQIIGTRLALVGVLNVVIGLLLTRVTPFYDAAGFHFGLR